MSRWNRSPQGNHGAWRAASWVRVLILSTLVIGGCTRNNPDYIDEGDAEPDPDLSIVDRGPEDGRTPLEGDALPPLDAAPDLDAGLDGAVDAGPDAAADASPDGAPDLALPVDDDEDGVPTPADCDDGDPAIYPGAPERCDGRDGDCDDAVDEGIAGLGAPCVAGTGVCRAEGRQICAPDGGLVCDAEAGAAGDELCNGSDDDCDGAVDEQVAGCCEPGDEQPCGSDEGACVTGIQICGGEGDFGPCEGGMGPVGEACDGIDRDCDGMIDEGYALGMPCGAGVGACAVEGRTVCAEGDVACDAIPDPPGDELCNAADDDCDGAVDEPFPDIGRPCAVGQGGCARQGVFVCGPDGVACDVEPGMASDEICNGVDDDCDGTPDESVGGGMPCEVGVGACLRAGVMACDAMGMLRCGEAAGAPADELCNGIDDDCDGAIDEAFPRLGDACVVQTGGCVTDGTIACGPDGGDVLCEAPPAHGADEVCNGLDDDCDGPVDEAFGVGEACVAGLGACGAQGVFVCDGPDAAACDGMPGVPSDETCNGIDDDCDGMPDEGFGLGEPCPIGVGACLADGAVVCGPDGPICEGQPGPPGIEDCDGVDDDCDGVTDEGVTNACGGCGPVPDETCDGIDDDCDGQVDEGTGVCVVFLGSAAAPDGVAGFGTALAAAGDLDGDGVGDALAGAPGGEIGAAVAVGGARFDVLWSVGDSARFGTDVAAGDIDGDGVRELFVGAPASGAAGALIQLDPAGGEVRRVPGTADFRAGRQIVAADGAPWVVMGDRDARPTFFGPAGALRVVVFGDVLGEVTLEGEGGAAMGARLHLAPDGGADGLPDVITTGNDFVDRAVIRFFDPPADRRSEPINPGFTNGSFGESVAFGRLLPDEPPIAVYGAPLIGARQSGGVYLYDTDGAPIGGPLANGGRGARQGHRLVVLPRPDASRDVLILSGAASAELRVWEMLRAVDGAPVIATSAALQVADAGASLGSAMVIGELGPDGTRRLFVGEPDALGGGRVHVFSAR